MMTQESASLTAIGLTIALSLLLVFYLQGPLRRILIELCGNEGRTAYWVAYTNIMLFLVPVLAELLTLTIEPTKQSPVLEVAAILRWGLLGIAIALFCVSMGLAVSIRPLQGTLRYDIARGRDLEQLLGRILEMRAREVTSKG